MRILILGGTGAMGVSLVQILTRQGNEVFVTSRTKQSSQNAKLHYMHGNAHDMNFLKNNLTPLYDVIVDFMVYNEDEFRERIELLLASAKQYVFLSSARVYAESIAPITEENARLLDVSTDEEYLKTDEYALSKARQENILTESKYKNWTIIRPYITYSEERLQLGVYEKEHWLYRALRGRKIVFSKDIATKYTTLTYGKDVSLIMANLLGNEKVLGESVNITVNQSIIWKDILNLYLDIIEEKTHKRPDVFYLDDSYSITKVLGCKYQIKYDRLYNRRFDSSKVNNICGDFVEYMPVIEGAKKCLSSFIENKLEFRTISWKFEAYMDKLTGEKTPLSEIPTWKERLKYIIWRYTPCFSIMKLV